MLFLVQEPMLFIICEQFSLKLFEQKTVDSELYNNMILKMYDLHKRTQHLELQEWKRTHNWYNNLRNISTVYNTVDEMFEIKHEASIDDFGYIPTDYNITSARTCSKYVYSVRSDCRSECVNHCQDKWGGATYQDICNKIEQFDNYNEALKAFSSLNEHKHLDVECVENETVDTYTGNVPVCLETKVIEQHVMDGYVLTGKRTWSSQNPNINIVNNTYCIKYVPFNETNIIGYINYKHAYNTNDEKWLIAQIQQLITENKHLYFEDYVKLFREKYYRIIDDDERLYKLIRQEIKSYKAMNKKAKIW